jgi:hypothetical protein
MLANTLHKKWLTRFFVLIYLLLSFSIANASFWCHGQEDSLRLEFNPSGQCWTSSNSVDDDPQHSEKTATTDPFWSALGGGCFDSPAYSSVITPSNRTSPLPKISTANSAIPLSFNPACTSEAMRLASVTVRSQLPTPQVLQTLRTVVLLH